MFVFRSLRFKNFLSTGNVFTELALDKSTTTLIVGRNGHGKSTMLDALTFVLFSKPFRKINRGNLVNSINNKDCLVEVEFDVNINKYKVRRGINPGIFEIYCNGNLVDQNAHTVDYQSYLENQILGFNYKSFTQIVILGSSSFVPFMKLGPQDRRAIIEDLLDIQIFSSMNRIVKNKLVEFKSNIIDNKKNIDNTHAKIELQKKYVEDSKKNNQEQINKKREELAENQAIIEKANNEIALIKGFINALISNMNNEEAIKGELRKLEEFNTKISTNKNVAEKELKFYHDNDNCPTCKQGIDHVFKSDAIQTRSSKISEFQTALAQLEEKQNQLNTILTDIQVKQRKINQHNAEIVKLNSVITHTQKYIEKLLTEINELGSKKVLSEDMSQVSRELVESLRTYSDQRRELIEQRAYYDVAEDLLRDNGIKAKIIKQYLPIINKLVNKYLASMDFFVNFELNEEFEETIKSRHRDLFTYDSFSEGEKQMIDIALLFAWRAVAKMKNSINTNLLVLDEIFDSSLDTVGADLLLNILNALPNDSNVFVISHRELLNDKFKNSIRFEKKNNFSEIVA